MKLKLYNLNHLSYLDKYLIKYKSYYILGIIFISFATFFAIVPAIVIRESFDLLENSYSTYQLFIGFDLQGNSYQLLKDNILIAVVIIILAASIRGLFLYLMRQTIIVASRNIEYDLKNEIYFHYQTLPMEFYKKNNTGDLINRISEDVSRVRMYLGPALMYGINVSILLLFIIPFMFYINFELSIYSLIPLPFLAYSIYYIQNIINYKSEEIQKSLSNLSTFVQESFSGIRIIKSFGREDDFSQKFDRQSKQYKDKALGLQFVLSLFFPIIMTLIGLSIIITVYKGSVEVFEGNISIGNIAEFLIYVALLTWPVTSLGWITSIIQRAAASQKRINEFLNQKNNITSEKNKKIDIKGKVEFKDICFQYKESGIKALNKINFKIEPGDSLGIIGSTGSGKSTISNLIPRLMNPQSGKIKIDDINIKDINVETLRRQIGYVPQDVFLFSDTIQNNISFGSEKENFDLIFEAAKNADLIANINKFPKKFKTKIGERGVTLSGGQKQRISIARAIIKNPKILIFDDCLSAVDTKTEKSILKSLKKIMKNKTSIIISHRISSVILAKKIIVLEDGEIVESGDHNSLIKQKGNYYKIFKKQNEEEELD